MDPLAVLAYGDEEDPTFTGTSEHVHQLQGRSLRTHAEAFLYSVAVKKCFSDGLSVDTGRCKEMLQRRRVCRHWSL